MTESGVQAVTTMDCKATQSTVEVKVCKMVWPNKKNSTCFYKIDSSLFTYTRLY